MRQATVLPLILKLNSRECMAKITIPHIHNSCRFAGSKSKAHNIGKTHERNGIRKVNGTKMPLPEAERPQY